MKPQAGSKDKWRLSGYLSDDMADTIKKLVIYCFLIFLSSQLYSQSATMYKSVKVDTARKVTSDQVVKIATRFLNRYYKNIFDASEKVFVDQNFKKLDEVGLAEADKLEIAEGLSSTAIVFTGTGESQNIPVVFSAKAVIAFPNDTLIVNNFGAVLRMLDSVKASVPVLLHAMHLYPNAPVVLTNLGNSFFELYNDKTAEFFYKKALKINPDFALARHGLVNVYFKRKDLQSAIEELFKGIEGVYSQSLSSAYNTLQNNPACPQPGKPSVETPENSSSQSQSSSSDSPNPNTRIDQLKIPPFPDWSDIPALMYDKSIDKNKKMLQEIMSGKCLSQLPMRKMTTEQMIEWAGNQNKPGRINYKGNTFAFDLMQQYFGDEIDKIDKKCKQADENNDKRYKQAMNQMAAEEKAASPNTADPEAWQEYIIKHCKDLTNLTANYFGEWKNVSRTRHNEYTDLLMTYWVYCEQYLNRTYDENEFEMLNCRRQMFVASKLMKLYVVYSGYQAILPLINTASFASGTGECPKMPPPPPPAVTGEDNINIPDKDAVPCPFKDGKFKVGAGACSLGLDCESIEAECGEGLIGAVKWNYKKKEVTIFAGAGVKGDFGVGKVGRISAEVKSGLEFTFNTDSQLIDAGMKTEFTTKAGIGNYQAGQNIEAKITAATGIDVNRTTELSAEF